MNMDQSDEPSAEHRDLGEDMSVSITCRHCKVTITADDEDELVRRVQVHVGTHERRTELTREHILGRLHRQSRA
jgi:predicted small metal-binding protein